MTVTALMKFTQGPNTDVAGRAVIGTLASVDGPVTVTNDDNTNVNSWEIILLDAPSKSSTYPVGSQPQVLASAVSNTPSANFSPDVPGTYRVLMDVIDNGGVRNRDIRCFGVPDERGVIEPPYQKNPDPLPITLPGILTPISDPEIKPDEQNYGGQPRGWAGDLSSGQLATFFQNYKDSRIELVTATPFNPTVDQPELILVNTTTIASASVVNLPGTTRVGQLWVVQDAQDDAFIYPITVNLPGGTTFPDGSSTSKEIFADGGRVKVRRISPTLWVVEENTNREEYIELFSGQDSTSNTAGYDRASSKTIDPTKFPPGARFVFEAMMETTNISNAHNVRLFNLSAASVVGTPLVSNSLTPELQSETFEVPADLPASAQIYEVQHQMAAGAGPDEVTLSSAQLRAVYATTG